MFRKTIKEIEAEKRLRQECKTQQEAVRKCLTSFEEVVNQSYGDCRNTILNRMSSYLSEENKENRIQQMLEMIELIEEFKKSVLTQITDIYNKQLTMNNDWKTTRKRNLQEMQHTINSLQNTSDITTKMTTIADITLLLIFITNINHISADNITIIITFFLAYNAMMNLGKPEEYYLKRHMKECIIDDNQAMNEDEKMLSDFYRLVDALRTDYHQSKIIIKELKERALTGEDVTIDALSLLNFSIEKTNTTTEEKPKTHTKRTEAINQAIA